jgi:hypothetical protein
MMFRLVFKFHINYEIGLIYLFSCSCLVKVCMPQKPVRAPDPALFQNPTSHIVVIVIGDATSSYLAGQFVNVLDFGLRSIRIEAGFLEQYDQASYPSPDHKDAHSLLARHSSHYGEIRSKPSCGHTTFST